MADAKAVFRIEGQDATAAAFNSATRNARKSAGDMEGSFKRAFGGMAKAAATFVSFRALTSAVKETLDFADSLNKAATQAGLTTEAMSELAYAAKLSGVETNQLSAAFRFMQKGLSEASQGIGESRLAIKALGLSLDEIRKLKPDEQFELIADRIAMLPDPADRARAAMKMFGDSGAQLLPMMEQGAEGVRKLREEAERLGQSFSKEQLDRLTAAKDAVDQLKASFSGLSVTLVAEVAPALTNFFNDLRAYVSNDEILKLEQDLIRIQRLIRETGEVQAGKRFSLPSLLGANNAKIAFDLAKQAADTQRAIDKLNGIGRRNIRGGARVKTGSDPIVPGFEKPGLEKERLSLIDQQTAAAKLRYMVTMQEFELGERFLEQEGKRLKLEMDRALRFTQVGPYQIAGTVTEQEARAVAASAAKYEQTMREFEENSTWLEQQKDKFSQVEEFAKAAAANIQSAFADFLFDPFQNGLKGMLAGFLNMIRRMVAEVAAQQILTALFSQYTNSGGFLGAFAKKITGNAMGGPVQSGTPYIVGERGPELFVPGYNGSIVPNTKMGGSVTVAPVYNIDARGATQDLVKQLPAILAQQARQTVELARRAINEDISRGALGRA